MKHSLGSVFEKVDFSQEFDVSMIDIGGTSKLSQNFCTILGIAKKVQKIRVQNLVSRLCHQATINIVRIYLNIDWKLKNSFHKVKEFEFSVFVLRELVREVNYNHRTAQSIRLGNGRECKI